MNIDTGKIYSTPEEIAAAKARGERLVQIPAEFANSPDLIEPPMNRKERRKAAVLARRTKRKAMQTQP